ncbi:MAG: hypothetical protein JEZ06_03925 [Anaerolineaceae bacterium]|nr:hypothetical protein [Anaerolineaceae bacterium]
MKSKRRLMLLLVAISLSIFACNLPSSCTAQTTANSADAVLTAAAETVQAQLTRAGDQNAPPSDDQPPQNDQQPEVPATETATPTVTNTATPTATLTNTPTKTPTKTPACNVATFIKDVSVPDGTDFNPGQNFTKTWRLKNVGSCTWTTAYDLIFFNGDQMGGPNDLDFTSAVGPGDTVDLTVALKAPMASGTYKGNWKLRSNSSEVFGLTNNAPFYVEIDVIGSAEIINFVDLYCAGEWGTTASVPGTIPCPGGTGDDEGFIVKWDNPNLETGSPAGAKSIETHPTWSSNPNWDPGQNGGWIQGAFFNIDIPSNAFFKTKIGCMQGAGSCNVNYGVKYRISSGGAWQSLGNWHEVNDGSTQNLKLDLSAIAGERVDFLLQVDANNVPGQDWAIWVNPRIETE